MSLAEILDTNNYKVYCAQLNDKPVNFNLNLPCYVTNTGSTANQKILGFVYEGSTAMGVPSALRIYYETSGLGTKSIALKSADLATTYYQSASLTGSGIAALTLSNALPADEAQLTLVSNNDNTGIVICAGLLVKY